MTETNETGEAGQVTNRKFAMMLSLAASSAEIAMQWRARQAERATQDSEQRQQALAEQARAERETQRVTWHRVLHGDRQLWRDPRQLAQAYASVTTWETVDRDAARASAQMQTTLRTAGIDPETVHAARNDGDYAAVAMLLQQRQSETAAENTVSGPTEPGRTHETVAHTEWSDGGDVSSPQPNAEDVQAVQQAAHAAAAQEVDPATAARQDLVEDPQLRQAAELVTDRQFGSTSMLQRSMHVEFGQSHRLMGRLHEAGIVGPSDGTRAREVYASRAQLDAMISAAENSRDAGQAANTYYAAAEGEHTQAQDAAVRGADQRGGAEAWHEVADEAHVAEHETPSPAEQEQQYTSAQDADHRAETLDGEAWRTEGAEGEHDRHAQRYQTGAYDAGAEQARLAGEAYPESVSDGLQRAQHGQRGAGQQSQRHRPHWRNSPERGR